MIGLAIFLLVILLVIILIFLRNIVQNLLLTLGVSIAVGFTLIKGISYHGLQQLYGKQVGFIHFADIIEYSGIVLAFIAAIARLRHAPLQTKSQNGENSKSF